MTNAKKINAVLATQGRSDNATVYAKAIEIHHRQTLVAMNAVGSFMEEINQLLKHESERAADRLMHTSHATETEVVIIALAAVAAGVVFSLFMTRYITTRMTQLTNFSGQMAKGGFTGHLAIDQQDEIGRLAASLKQTQAN